MIFLTRLVLLAFIVVGPFTLMAQPAIDVFNLSNQLSQQKVNVAFPEEVGAPSFCPCTITQDGNNFSLPFFSNNQSAVNFYSYGVPLGACANTGFEQSEHLILMLYEDTNTGEVSFIFIADIANDPTGGEMKVTLSCMPNSTYVALEDDPGEFSGSPPTFTGNFVWSSCCTDGGIVGGLGCGYSFIFDIDQLSGIDVITLLYGSPANPIWVNLPSSECPFIINCGGPVCCDIDIIFDAVVENANCNDSDDGTLDLEVTGDCLGPTTYMWSNGETTEDLTDLAPGDYTVTVTDPNGCSAEETFTVGVEYQNPTPSINGPPWYCEGEIVELNVLGNYNSYEWSNAETTSSIFISTPGTYSVTVSNDGGCTGTASITIEEYAAPIPVISGPTEICPNETVQLDAGPGYSLYEWSTGGFMQTTFISDPGTYSVLVTNNFGCTGEAFWDVTELPGPEPIINGPESICAGQTILLEVDDIYATYLWSTGATVPQIEVTAPGIYFVTVTNQEACPGIAVWEVKESFAVPLVITGDTLACPGDSTTLLAPPIYSEYFWSTSEMSESIQVLGPGTFGLIVIDDFGCRDTADITLGLFPPIDPQIMGNTVICPNDSAVLSPGNGYATYLWSTGEQSSSISVFSSGSYSVDVSDANGCTGSDTVVVILNTADTTLLFASSCHPQDTGVFKTILNNQYGCDSITFLTVSYDLADTTLVAAASCDPQDQGVEVQVLTSQYGCDSVVVTNTILLPSDSSKAQAYTCDLASAGLSYIHLTNQWGCDSTIELQTLFIPTDTTIITSTTCDPLVADTSVVVWQNQYGCDSLVVQSIALLPSSKKTQVFYSCNPLDTGTVVQTLVNQYGCDSTLTWKTLLVPLDSCILRVTPTVTPGPCAGDPGKIVLDADLGSFPVQVNWWLEGSGTPQQGTWSSFFSPYLIPGLLDGTYILDLTDSDGHSWMDTVMITSPLKLNANLMTSPVINGFDLACAGDETASLTVNYLSGGTLPLTMKWSTGANGPSLNNLSAGAYTATVTDAHGCTLILTDTLVEPPLLKSNWTVFQDPCDGQPAEVVSTNVSGGVTPVTYALNGGTLPGQTWPSLPDGSVLMEVRDANGCVADTLITIEPESVFTVELGPNQLHEENKLIFLLAQIIPDSVALASIQWSPELCKDCLNPAFRVKETTTITVTVTSLGGCTSTDAVLIELDRRDIYIPNSFSPNNDGLNDLFAPQGDPELEVVDFAIFDRWGDEVYRSGGFHLGDPDVGWNGDARDQPASIDVYVYAMVLRWKDGQERLFKGDLQLMR
ncbi:MAG: gliding motility-associated C-terminal domain-containing protein [Saprospiraceae bacterium]|nr:gliding motility-associated C-terminal domain-containing protein [Saprospiraceae bacterium]